jgi:hypothetical protein
MRGSGEDGMIMMMRVMGASRGEFSNPRKIPTPAYKSHQRFETRRRSFSRRRVGKLKIGPLPW